MFQLIECSGHPRDLGFSQGRALRELVRERVKGVGLPLHRRRWPSLRPFVHGSVKGRGVSREMIRHYTHLAERTDGLARGANLPVDSLFSLQGQTDPAVSGEVTTLCAAGLDGTGGGTLVRGLRGPGWVVRRSRPRVGFQSVELTHAWWVTAVAGINEASLAVCLVPHSDLPASETAPLSLAPARLLVQECLQRFGDVEAGLDWCTQRPASDSVDIWLTDESGARRVVRFQGEKRSVIYDQDGPRVTGAPLPMARSLCDTVESEGRLDLKLLERALEEQRASAYVRLSCGRLGFEVKTIGSAEEAISLELEPCGREAS